MARFGFSITLISAVPAAAFIPRPNALTATRRTSNWQGGSTEAAPLGSTEKEGENSLLGWAARPAGVEKEGEGPLLGDSLVVSDLPDSFDQAVEGAAACTVQALADGWSRLRVDFDTSGGDATYTMLKSSMPMTQRFIASTAAPLLGGATNSEAGGEEGAASERTIRLYFPDAGSAALAQRDWKVGTASALVPPCARFASLSRDTPDSKDAALIFICPRASEVDALKKVLAWHEEKLGDEVPLIFINPDLVDMGVTGFGLAGRMLRESLINTLVPAYYLRTLEWGAVTRSYPLGFSTWLEDESAEGGYTLLDTRERLPNAEDLDELYSSSAGGPGGGDEGGGNFLAGFGKFVQGFGRI